MIKIDVFNTVEKFIWESIIYKLEDLILDTIGNNSPLETRLYKLITRKESPSCGNYSRWEECCNVSWICDSNECPCGIGGIKRLPLSQLIFNIVCRINRLRSVTKVKLEKEVWSK